MDDSEADGLLEEGDTERNVEVELSMDDKAAAFELSVCEDVAETLLGEFAPEVEVVLT